MDTPNPVESSMDFSLCRGCRRNLTNVYPKFKWFVKRGYSQKDAAAQVLYRPGGITDIPECCVLNLQTNFDSNKDIIDRAILRENQRRAEMEKIKGESGRVPERQIVRIFAANETRTVGGTFILRDVPPVEVLRGAQEAQPMLKTVSDMIPPYPPVQHKIDPNSGAEYQYQDATRTKGFTITNIALIPKTFMDSLHWRGLSFMILWSGNIKIIPVIDRGGELTPAKMYLQFLDPATGLESIQLIDRFDKSLLEAEIIDYRNTPLNLANSGIIYPDSITLRKQFPQNIIA